MKICPPGCKSLLANHYFLEARITIKMWVACCTGMLGKQYWAGTLLFTPLIVIFLVRTWAAGPMFLLCNYPELWAAGPV